MNSNTFPYIAHRRKQDGAVQSLEEHLLGVAEIAKSFATKIGLEEQGELIGLLHDLGKYSKEFQTYLTCTANPLPTISFFMLLCTKKSGSRGNFLAMLGSGLAVHVRQF